MLEDYIDQIVTMNILADSITIIDNKQIIRYFKAFNSDVVPFQFSDVIGMHFRTAFPDVDPEKSAVLKALRGEATIGQIYTHQLFNGKIEQGIESVFPIRMGNSIIGSISVTRFIRFSDRFVDIRTPEERQKESYTISDLIGISPGMQSLKLQILQVADANANVLIYGETGTGKELVAQAIHNASSRNKQTFFSQNCAAIPSALLESIFFGTERGAYTGAVRSPGIFEQANGGTVFLDEINSLDFNIQGKLLKALEEKKIRRLGSNKEIISDFRILSASNENPFDCMKSGKIRSDLFFRLSTVILEIPPLRFRRKDIPVLAHYFMEQLNRQSRHKIRELSPEVLELFMQYKWPGNVRELKNTIECAAIFSKSHIVQLEDLPAYITHPDGLSAFYSLPEPPKAMTIPRKGTLKELMEQYEAQILSERLKENGNRTLLAQELGISRQTLFNKLTRYGLQQLGTEHSSS